MGDIWDEMKDDFLRLFDEIATGRHERKDVELSRHKRGSQ